MNKDDFKELQRDILKEFDAAFHRLRMLIQTPNPAYKIAVGDLVWVVETLEELRSISEYFDWKCHIIAVNTFTPLVIHMSYLSEQILNSHYLHNISNQMIRSTQ